MNDLFSFFFQEESESYPLDTVEHTIDVKRSKSDNKSQSTEDQG